MPRELAAPTDAAHSILFLASQLQVAFPRRLSRIIKVRFEFKRGRLASRLTRKQINLLMRKPITATRAEDIRNITDG